MDAGSDEKVFGLSEAQIARRVKAATCAADLPRLGEFQLPQRADGHGPAHGDAARDVGAVVAAGSPSAMHLSLAGLCTKIRYVAEPAHFVLWLAY